MRLRVGMTREATPASIRVLGVEGLRGLGVLGVLGVEGF